jgi:protein-disulfide isomerase
MTHFENEENTEQVKHPEHNEHSERKTHHKTEKTHCDNMKLNTFQKFLAVAVIIQILILLFVAIKISSLASVAGENNVVVEAPTPTANPTPSGNDAPSVDMTALIDDDSVKGDPDAPVTIVEFSDYECPFCARFYNDAYQQIKSKYIDTGKVKLVYRDFPLSFHQNAQKAAEAAECAGEQDKYYEMHDLLFEEGVEGGVTKYKQYANRIGLNSAKFDVCLDSGAMAQEVRKDFSAGQQLGVSGTPAFFINGQKLVGAQPFSAFEPLIEQALNS